MISTSRWARWAIVLMAGAAGLWALEKLQSDRADIAGVGLALHDVLGNDDGAAGFARADQPIQFEFPEDHGAHPAFRSEWWYFTGNLENEKSEPIAYQLTLFRNSLNPTPASGQSAWRTNQIFMGHLAVTDIEAGNHYAFELFGRDGLNMAGASSEPVRIWLDGWEIGWVDDQWAIQAAVGVGLDRVSIALNLTGSKPLVLQGDRGYSQKSAGNASYYYSETRLETEGRIQLQGNTMAVAGDSWLDREWSTSSLSRDQAGWDWFSLQLNNGWELMFYRMRLLDGSTDAFSAGGLVNPAGEVTALASDQLVLSVERRWTSHDGTTYPVQWRLKSTAHKFNLLVNARTDDSEMRLTFRYWEGAVVVSGEFGDRAATGLGFMELTGYASDASRK